MKSPINKWNKIIPIIKWNIRIPINKWNITSPIIKWIEEWILKKIPVSKTAPEFAVKKSKCLLIYLKVLDIRLWSIS